MKKGTKGMLIAAGAFAVAGIGSVSYTHLDVYKRQLHYDLVALHVQIQLLAANWKLRKTEQALELLRRSLSQAFPDGILMPFVENYPYIEELLKGSFFGINENFLFRITRMGKEWEMRCDQLKKRRRIRRSLKYCQIASWRLRSLWQSI